MEPSPTRQPRIDERLETVPRAKPVRSRSWCFTVNNPVGPIEFSEFGQLLYGVYQSELAPTTGTLHYQGYCQFSQPQSRRQLAALLPDAHLEPARGNAKQCIAYCTKLDSRVEGTEPVVFGKPPSQGKRSDLLDFRDSVLEGSSDRDLLVDDQLALTYLRYPELASKIRLVMATPRLLDRPPSVILCIGPPGCGKSTFVRKQCSGAYYLPNPGRWWPSYESQRTVVLEDFSGSHLSFTCFKNLLDAGPYCGEVKGGHVQVVADEFYITSNKHPGRWYSDDVLGQYGRLAVYRRITRILVFSADFSLNDICDRDDVAQWLSSNEDLYQ